MASESKAMEKGDAARPRLRLSRRHFTPRPTKPGIGRPVRGRASGGGGRP